MRTSDEGLNEIIQHEGEKLNAYLDTGGVWTIGVGHTKGVKQGDRISKAESRQFLKEDVVDAEEAVNKLVTVPLNQNMFDALVSFVFNLGITQFRKSTLLRLLNQGLYKDAAEEFLKWKYDNGKEIKGLAIRREKERQYFLGPA